MRHTSVREAQHWLSNLEQLVGSRTCASPEFIRPFHFVSLALTLKAEKAASVAVPEALIGYATRMHLWEAVGIAPPRRINEHDGRGKFVPIEPLRSRAQVQDCSKRVSQIAAQASMDAESCSSLSTSLSELIDNCFSHAGVDGDLHGLACAQFWPKGNLMQVAIADMGMGIRATFEQADREEFRRRAASENCCSLATELGASSKLNGDHAGYGLALARQLAEQNGGSMLVCSDNEWCHTSNGMHTAGVSDVRWKGTLVVVEFDTQKKLSTQEVYRNWPPVRGYTDDDFDF